MPGTHLVWTRPGPREATFGVDVGDERSVSDDGFATAAGAPAGLERHLEPARRIGGDDVARAIHPQIEYDPRPPPRAGSPRTAPGELVESLRPRARAYGWRDGRDGQ